jgi:defect in organelle trafficking protein DotD
MTQDSKQLTFLRVIRSGLNPFFLPSLKVLMRSTAKCLTLVCGFVLLVACEQQGQTGPSVTPVATEPDIVTVKLAQAADKASKALDSIAGIEQVKNPAAPPLEDYAGAPSNLMQPVTLRWSGPIEPVTRALAQRAGLKFRVKGNQPAVPLTVNIDVYEQPIIHVLRDLGLQAGHRADIAADAAGGAIEVRYAPSDRSQ